VNGTELRIEGRVDEKLKSSDRVEVCESRGRGQNRRLLALAFAIFVMLVLVLPVGITRAQTGMAPVPSGVMNPLMIPKWANQITGPPPVYVPTPIYDESGQLVSQDYRVEMTQLDQQILPSPLPKTHVWAYSGPAKDSVTGDFLGVIANSPGPSFESTRGISVNVEWVNNIQTPHMFAVDPTLHWADPNNMGMPMEDFPSFPPGFPEAQTPVPLVTHLHGGEVQSTSDGGPEAWFTWDGKHGSTYNTYRPADPNAAVYHYPNAQPATTLWYHDHALGMTRINVMSGLAGFYILRDHSDQIAPLLPSGKYEVPLAIQDRTFKTDGSFYFDSEGLNPDIHPYWNPEFFGNAIMVNGLAWPNMNVDQGQYRFRVLDGSNARFYTLAFSNMMPFTVIGTDGGYLKYSATMTKLTIAPGERYDILVDFSNLAPGTKVVLTNSAKAPYPTGKPPIGATTGQIMQFTVTSNKGFAPQSLPMILNPTLVSTFPTLPVPVKNRTLVLTEIMGMEGPLEILLNGQKWSAPVSETPVLGTTEEWVIINPTADTHPIHLHLTQFQLVSRQRANAQEYYDDWVELNGEPPFYTETPQELPVAPYLKGKVMGPQPQEMGWKDTVQMNPGEVTIIRVRFAPIDGSPSYPFDATYGPGYVWHCHIIDHEDNEMMRPYIVVAATARET
jgi:FtsP/CotA-like multicopper oxidase with cupredoxin domain